MQKYLPVSLITTVYNESRSIERFLNSMANQTVLPEDLVIVDGGSKDATVQQIESFSHNNSLLRIKLVKNSERINIARGRNIAIKNSKHEIIAATDAGCMLENDWLENIVSPLLQDGKIDIVSGWYEILAETEFEKERGKKGGFLNLVLKGKTILLKGRLNGRQSSKET